MTYKLFEHKKAKKFLKKHDKDKKLLLRITKKYMEILKKSLWIRIYRINKQEMSKMPKS